MSLQVDHEEHRGDGEQDENLFVHRVLQSIDARPTSLQIQHEEHMVAMVSRTRVVVSISPPVRRSE